MGTFLVEVLLFEGFRIQASRALLHRGLEVVGVQSNLSSCWFLRGGLNSVKGGYIGDQWGSYKGLPQGIFRGY